jgi:hypothetical protein
LLLTRSMVASRSTAVSLPDLSVVGATEQAAIKVTVAATAAVHRLVDLVFMMSS